jgi:folate-binding protein YgfZ
LVEDIVSQYHSIGSSPGWLEPPARGRLRFEGGDAASFLQALISNDVLALQPGHGLYATFLTPQGRMVADLEVHRLPDAYLAVVPSGQGAALCERFDNLIFSEDVRVSDLSAALLELALVGLRAAEALARAYGLDVAQLSSLRELAHVSADDGLIVRSGEARVPVFRLLVPAGQRDEAVARLQDAGAVSIAPALFEALRIEAGRPLWGRDMSDETIPLEAGLLDRAISTTKGCYVGQEIIIRVLHRGKGRVAKRLVTLAFDAAAAPGLVVPGAGLSTSDGADIGRLTSVSLAPDGTRLIALGYVGRDYAAPGVQVRVAGSTRHGTVTGLAG